MLDTNLLLDINALLQITILNQCVFFHLSGLTAMDLDLIGRNDSPACKLMQRLVVRSRGRVIALGDVAVCFAIFAHTVGEDGAEERSHEGDAGAHAAYTRLE